MNGFESSKAHHPATIHWQRREAALATEGIPKQPWWQRFRNRPKHATFLMMWRY